LLSNNNNELEFGEKKVIDQFKMKVGEEDLHFEIISKKVSWEDTHEAFLHLFLDLTYVKTI